MKGALFAALWLGSLLVHPTSGRAQDSNDAAAQELRRQLQALHWVKGPQQVRLFGVSTLQVPEGYVFLEPADTAKLQALQKNLSSDNQYFFAPRDFHWQASMTNWRSG